MGNILVGFLAATLRISTPYIWGGSGEMVIEKSGVLNLGIEGIMLLSAFTGFLATFYTHSPAIGLLVAVLTGIVLALFLGVLVVSRRFPQYVCGLGLTLLTIALSRYFYRIVFGTPASPPKVETFGYLELGGGVFRQYFLTYLALVLVIALKVVLDRTRFGLQLKMAGENPAALDTAGVNPHRIRYQALAIGGALIGVSGAFLSIAQLGFFTEDVVSGRGWVCLALVIFGNWRPFGLLAGALLFAGIEAAQMRAQVFGLNLPHEVFSLLPYLLTVLALAFLGNRSQAPEALLKPYPEREEG